MTGCSKMGNRTLEVLQFYKVVGVINVAELLAAYHCCVNLGNVRYR